MPNNPKLKKNLISEALIEIRFKAEESEDFPLVLGAINQNLKNDYPIHESLNVPDFGKPAPDELNYMVKSRLYSADKKRLYSLGNGVLSVNTLAYTSFEDFIKQINQIFKQHKELSNLKKITRIGIRYINKVEFQDNPNDIINIKFDIPKEMLKNQSGFRFQSLSRIGEDGLMTQYAKKDNAKELTLDFDYYFKGEKEYNLKNINEWINNAHNNIHKTFVNCLNKKYYTSLK